MLDTVEISLFQTAAKVMPRIATIANRAIITFLFTD